MRVNETADRNGTTNRKLNSKSRKEQQCLKWNNNFEMEQQSLELNLASNNQTLYYQLKSSYHNQNSNLSFSKQITQSTKGKQ